jgi:hypothetical protein
VGGLVVVVVIVEHGRVGGVGLGMEMEVGWLSRWTLNVECLQINDH